MTQQRLLRPAMDHSSLNESELQIHDRAADTRRTTSAQQTLWPGENIPTVHTGVLYFISLSILFNLFSPTENQDL